MEVLAWIVLFFAVTCVCAYQRASLTVIGVAYGILLILVTAFSHITLGGLLSLWIVFALFFSLLMILPLRRHAISTFILNVYRRKMPSMSSTEKEALSAGEVGWEGELFSGMPDWDALRKMPSSSLSVEERDFLQGPVEELCGLIDNWSINYQRRQIPDEIWQFLKVHGFFGLIIPTQYGGKGFSALAHSQIIAKVSSVSGAVGVVVSVPNSLGPAELLLEYGTEEQKNYFLPRLAKGEEVPCFALTSAVAGSDAGSIEDRGVVCKKVIDGQERLGIILNWDKRYITLAPVATLIGLAFKLYDPENLLGHQYDIGITCALIPANTPGVSIGRRHIPLNSHFPNGPTQGLDVFIPLEWVIGGKEKVGNGWRMLMECLAAGRSISLPSMVTGSAKRSVYTCGAYARIRHQFNTYIGAFGGIQEALAYIGAYTYLIEATRLFSVTAIDRGIKSAVSSAICKYHTTEYGRKVINNAVDIHGGKAICMGPNNYIAQSYIETPISITVEGANILTRSMIIFGQGAIRCHPYILAEMEAAASQDRQYAIHYFDEALFKHLGMILSNKVRTFFLALSSSRIAGTPGGDLKRFYQHFSRFSAAFAFIADISVIVLGGELKRKERLSARLGDMLSFLYMGSAVIKYYEIENNKSALPIARWVCQHLLFELQTSMHEFLLNLPQRWLARIVSCIVFPLGRRFSPPSDQLGKKVAELLLEPSILRDQLTKNTYIKKGNHKNPISDIQEAFSAMIAAEPLFKRLHQAERNKEIVGFGLPDKIKAAVKSGIMSEEEASQLAKANELRMAVIHVDDFSPDHFS